MVGDAEDLKRWEQVRALWLDSARFREKAIAADTPQHEREKWLEAAELAGRRAQHLIV